MKQTRTGCLLFLCLLSGAFPLFAQSDQPLLSAHFRQADLREVISIFEKKHALSFSFDDEAVRDIRINAQFADVPLREAMRLLFDGTGLDFEIIDNQYVLIKKAAETERVLCGKILDRETGDPLPGATAHIRNSPYGTAADAHGNFTLKGRFNKMDTLEISYLGYRRFAVNVGNFPERPCPEFRLQAETLTFPDVIIYDFATDMLTLGEQGSFHFDRKKMPTLPGWGEPDVLRTLQLLPGIGSADESGARLNVRGSTPDQNLVLLDGIPIYHTGHFFGLYDAFNPYIVDGVDAWRGNFGAVHGGRNASVIDIRTKTGFSDKTQWGTGMNLLSTQGYIIAPLKKEKVSLLFAARRSYIDGLQQTAYRNFFNQIFQNGKIDLQEEYRNDEFVTWNPAIAFGDANLKLSWKGKKQRESAVSLYTSEDRLDYRFAYDDGLFFSKTEDVIQAGNFGMSWQHQAQWSPVFKVKYSTALSSYNNNYTLRWNEADRERPFIYRWETNNSMTDFSARFHHDWQAGERHRMSFGYQFSAQEAVVVYRDTNAVRLEGNVWSNDTVRNGLHTFYAEFAYQPSDKFGFTLGIRENRLPSRGLYFSEPRLGFTWLPFGPGTEEEGKFTVKGGMGRHWQFVFQIIDFGDLGVGEPLWTLTDELLPAQELWQWTLGFSIEKKSMLLDAEFYRKNSRNLTSLNLRTDRGFERPWSFGGESVANGFDLLLRKRWRGYSIWAAYSLGKVTMQFPELNGGFPYPARHDIRHRLNFVNMVNLKKWELAANWHVRSGTPYSIPSVVQVPCLTCTADSLTWALEYGRLNAARLAPVVRLDLSATYKWQKKRNRGKAGLSIYNLRNRRNLLDKEFLLETPPHDEPQSTYKLQELDRLAARVTPSFFVLLEW